MGDGCNTHTHTREKRNETKARDGRGHPSPRGKVEAQPRKNQTRNACEQRLVLFICSLLEWLCP